MNEIREKPDPFQIVILVLSVYVLVAMFVEAVVGLPPDIVAVLHRIDTGICVIFLTDFFVRRARAKSKSEFLRWGWIDFVSSIPAVDVLRWARVVRIFRVLRILRAVRSTRLLVTY